MCPPAEGALQLIYVLVRGHYMWPYVRAQRVHADYKHGATVAAEINMPKFIRGLK